jgi:hypothetical protein
MGVSMEQYTSVTTHYEGVHFVVSPNGFVSPIPERASGPHKTRAPGMQYVGGSGGWDFNDGVSTVRIMDPDRNQSARTVYENPVGQKVNPFTGETIPNDHVLAHFYHDQKYSKASKL